LKTSFETETVIQLQWELAAGANLSEKLDKSAMPVLKAATETV
jgi:hypothetical protein